MTLIAFPGSIPKAPLLDTFFDDVARARGWKALGDVMWLVTLLERGAAPYHLIGPRTFGTQAPTAPLRVLVQTELADRDFDRLGLNLLDREGLNAAMINFEIALQEKDHRIVNFTDDTGTLEFHFCLTDTRIRSWRDGLIHESVRCYVAWLYSLPKEDFIPRWERLIRVLDRGDNLDAWADLTEIQRGNAPVTYLKG